MILWLAGTALGAEVVWLEPTDDDTRALVARQAGASGPALQPLDLRAAATSVSTADEQVLRDLTATLEDVRAYETQLDGELVIMRDLEQAIVAIPVLRDETDRSSLFSALTYQGFAVARFFGDTLESSPEAEPWRASFDGQVVERPWLDAIAIEPDREVTPYEIAEAPQRVVYGQRVTQIGTQLPASLTVDSLPAGASLVVDGRPLDAGPAGNVKVRPGRHLAHAEIDGRVIQRWDVTVEPGESQTLVVALSDDMWQAFLADVMPGASVPEPIGAAVRSLGGEVWLARSGAPATVVAVTPTSVSAVEIVEPVSAPPEGDDDGARAIGVSVALLGGWLTSGDFYTQDPLEAPRTVATVNSASIGAALGADFTAGLLRAGAGIDVFVPTGQYAVARSGDGAVRVRATPHVAVGIPWAQVAAGYLLPYHPAVGARFGIGGLGPLELRAVAWYGLPTSRTRADGSVWDSLPVATVSGGFGVRL